MENCSPGYTWATALRGAQVFFMEQFEMDNVRIWWIG